MQVVENLYEIIADNIRQQRKQLNITQWELAEKADLSLDTVKSVESGRRAMSLDTYLKIVQALETTPFVFIEENVEERLNQVERFLIMTGQKSQREVEFILHIVEQIIKGQDSYLG
ncbi:MAG: helix-turn-helix transcriptional regulator [Lachnospiraceae bacterium]|nr:helix-turn-helix transcriptional regulator [Lachnospiraceae bacterium]